MALKNIDVPELLLDCCLWAPEALGRPLTDLKLVPSSFSFEENNIVSWIVSNALVMVENGSQKSNQQRD